MKTNNARSTAPLYFTKFILQNIYIWTRINIINIRYWNSAAFDFIRLYWQIMSLCWHNWMQNLLSTLNVGYLVDFVLVNDSRCKNTFASSGCIIYKTDKDFNILIIFFISLVGTYRTSIFECLIGKNNTFLIASCVETFHLVKNALPIEEKIFNIFSISLFWCFFYKFTHC